MAWRLHDYIHLNLTKTKLSGVQSCKQPLKMLDSLLDDNTQIRFITFSPQTALKRMLFGTLSSKLFAKTIGV